MRKCDDATLAKGVAIGSAARARALRSGFLAHLPKPIEPDALINAVTNLAGTAAPSEF